MATFHDEVEIEDFEFDEELETFFYPCPCGDKFQITLVDASWLPNSFQFRSKYIMEKMLPHAPVVPFSSG